MVESFRLARLTSVRFAVSLLGAFCIVGCNTPAPPSGPVYLKPIYRFVDPHLNPVNRGHGIIARIKWALGFNDTDVTFTGDYAVASIEDESRFVVKAPPRGLVFKSERFEVPANGRGSVATALNGALAGASQVVVVPQFDAKGGWERLPATLLKTSLEGNVRRLATTVLFPPRVRGQVIRLQIIGYSVDGPDPSKQSTRPVEIPKGAIFEFSLGILEPAWSQGPVDFQISACRGGSCDVLFKRTLDPSRKTDRGWQDGRIALQAYAGEKRRFVFEASLQTKGDGFSLPVWANPTVFAPAIRSAKDSNVILLSVDTLRADHLTSYGYYHDTAPFIEMRFGKGGTVFENCVAAATTTTPSHMSIFTGLQPVTHGLTTGLQALSRNIVTLGEVIRSNKAETGAITENGWLGIQHGFGRGFNTYAENKSLNILAPTGQVDVTFAKARTWLRRNRNKRFFLFLHTFQVHDPYAPPERYASLFSQDEHEEISTYSPQNRHNLANYDREIRYTDDELRRLFSTIDELDLAPTTIFVLTSDHGEEFLEHGLLGHGAHMHQEAVHVPLMLWGNGIPKARRVETVVAHVDIMPTIVQLMGMQWQGPGEGLSLTGWIKGDVDPVLFSGRPVFSESRSPIAVGPNRVLVPFTPPAFGVRVENHKLARYRKAGGYYWEYYDLDADPRETNNLFSERVPGPRDLVTLIETYEARSLQVRRQITPSIKQAPSPETAQPTRLDPQQEEKLKALGYMQ